MRSFKVPTKLTYFGTESVSNIEMFQKLIEIVNLVLSLVGFGFFTPGWTLYNLTASFMFGNFFLVLFVHGYSLNLYHNDLERVFFLLMTLTGSVQGSAKLYTYVFKLEIILDQMKKLENFLKNFENVKMCKIFEVYLLIVCHAMIAATVIFLAFGLATTFYPILGYFIIGERILIFGFEFPFLDWKTSILAYAFNLVWNYLLTVIFIIGTLSSIFLSLFPILMTLGQFKVLETLLKELEEFIKLNKNGKNDKKIKDQLKIVAEKHNEILE